MPGKYAFLLIRFLLLTLTLSIYIFPTFPIKGAEPPGFSKSFSPASINTWGLSTLTFTIDNSANAISATSLAFTDNFPAAITVATPSNLTTTCLGGTITAIPGSGVFITYVGGSIGAGSTCIISVDVIGNIPGFHVNVTEDLTSSLGNSGNTSDSLTVTGSADISVTITDDEDPINAGENLMYTLTVANDGPDSAPGVVCTDTLPAEVSLISTSGCAEDPSGIPTCTLGDIDSGNMKQYKITVKVDRSAKGTLINFASAISSISDPVSENNSANESTFINPALTLAFPWSIFYPAFIHSNQ